VLIETDSQKDSQNHINNKKMNGSADPPSSFTMTRSSSKQRQTVVAWLLAAVSMTFYRLWTRVHALYSLATLDESDHSKFHDSYILFDGDWSNNNGKKESHIIDYYRVINHLCALGNVEKMYIPPLLDEKAGVIRNQELYERKMMADIDLPPDGSHSDKKVLDIGCGRGRIAMHAAKATGAFVEAMNIDPSQIANAKNFSKRIGLDSQTNFKVASFNCPLPFQDAYFDAAYNVQAFSYSMDKEALFREIYRVMKPGAKFTLLEWVLLDNFDPKDAEHVDYVKKTMPFIGAVDTIHYSVFENAMRKAGFEILLSEDASIGGHQGPLINSERAHYAWIRTFAKYFLPQRFTTMLLRLKVYAEAFVMADKLRIATTSYQIVCKKPDHHPHVKQL
jgi:sterol 24-C-methyltransferase